jgi:hypothetical protein
MDTASQTIDRVTGSLAPAVASDVDQTRRVDRRDRRREPSRLFERDRRSGVANSGDDRFDPRRASPVQAELNGEWTRRYASGRVGAPRSWRDDRRLAGYRFAADAWAELDRPETPHDRAEEIAEALAVAAAGGDEVAARVMVQYLLPRLAVVAWGDGVFCAVAEGEDAADALDAMVSTVWLSLATGDALRGDSGVVMRLLRDAEYQVVQRPGRRRAREAAAIAQLRSALVCDLTGRPDGVAAPAAEELLEVVCDARRQGLALADARLLAALGVAGVSAAEVAEAEVTPVTARCVRYRRDTALRRVRLLTVAA